MKSSRPQLSNEGLRKAAILVASIDHRAADAILDQLTPEQAQYVRHAVLSLDDIPEDEQQRVLDEFANLPSRATPIETSGVELAGQLAQECAPYPVAESRQRTSYTEEVSQRPFQGLHEAEGDKLARLLSHERPQTIALVLSHLPAQQSGHVLASLPTLLQADVIQRLVDLEETDPAIIREIEQTLEIRLAQQVHMQPRRIVGVDALNSILEASSSQVRFQILDNLAIRNGKLAARLGPPPMEFEEIFKLDSRSLAEIIRNVKLDWLLPALLGLEPRLIERLLHIFPAEQAAQLRQKLNSPGPIRLSDVEIARRRIAEIARRIRFANQPDAYVGSR